MFTSIRKTFGKGSARTFSTIDLTSNSYQWTLSNNGTAEYYLEFNGGGDPGIPNKPRRIILDGKVFNEGTVGSLNQCEWDWANNDGLSFTTIYIRGCADEDINTISIIDCSVSFLIDPLGLGLNHHWTFEDGSGLTATDSGIVGNKDGVLVGSVAFSTDSRVGTYSTDYSGGYVNVGSTPTLLSSANDWTIALFFKLDSLGGDDIFFDNWGGTGLQYYHNVPGNRLRVYIDGSVIGGVTTLTAGQWYHTALSHNSSTGIFRLYLDGVEESNVSDTLTYNSRDLWFGRSSVDGEPHDGRIDDMRLYSRTLSPFEISQLANQ